MFDKAAYNKQYNKDHKEEIAAKNKARREAKKAQGIKVYSRKRKRKGSSRTKHDVAVEMVNSSKKRAKEKGLAHNISTEDFTIPNFCPVFGNPLVWGDDGATDNSPALDRINSNRGYVKGNVQVISNKANRMKNDGTPEEAQRLAKFMSR